MITVIRERLLGNKIYKYIVFIFAIVLGIMWTVPGLFKQGSDQWVAKVNGQKIEYKDFARKVHENEQQLQLIRQQYGQYADVFLQAMGLNADPKVLALDSLIRETLLNKAAQRLGTSLHDDYVSERLADANFVQQVLSDLIPPYVMHPTDGINMKQLKVYLRRSGMSLADFEQKVQEALSRIMLIELAALGHYTPEFELKEKYATDYLGKKFSVLTFSFADRVKKEKEKPVSSDNLQDFYTKQLATNHYRVPEKRSGNVWEFDPKAYGIVVDDEDVQEYYNARKTAEFLETPAQLEVRTIVFKVDGNNEHEMYKKAKETLSVVREKPDLFAQKARELSQDESAKKDGKLAPFAKGSHEADFDRAAFLLKADGDISEIIKTKKGFEILQRIGKVAPTYKSLSSVKSDIKAKLIDQKFGERFAQDLRLFVDQEDVTDQAFNTFVKEHGGKVTAYDNVDQNSVQVKDKKALKALFGAQEKELNFYVANNAGFVVKPTSIKKSFLPSLDSIKDTVTNDFYEAKAAESLQEILGKAQAESTKNSLKEVGSQFGGTLKTIDTIKKSDTDRVASLRTEGLPIEKMLLIEKPGVATPAIHDRNGYLVVVDSIEPIKNQEFNAKKDELGKELHQERMRTAIEGFVASLYRNATIKANESLLSGKIESTRKDTQNYEE